jgi:hypothetical protein
MSEQAAEITRVMAVKAAMVQTTNTLGWNYIKQLADNIVKKTIDEALEEEDSLKGESKRLKAAALKKGFSELFNAIETAKTFSVQSEEEEGFGSLDYETVAKQS